MEVRVQPVKMGFDAPYVVHRNPLSFAERLDSAGTEGSHSLAARGAASAGLVFGGGTLAVVLFLLAMAGLSDGQTIFQSRPLFSRDSLKKLDGKPLVTARSVGRPPMVYHNGQTVGVVALGPGKTLLDCELIETYNPEEKQEVLSKLARSHLRSLEVTFNQMMELMRGCHELADSQGIYLRGPRKLVPEDGMSSQDDEMTRSLSGGFSSVFQGILPGTKWCGTGDIAETYYDLGYDAELDTCCRTHDLCPAKIRAHTSRYNLTNNSFISKSHCECDEMFYNCLKGIGNQNAMMIGNIYFNVLRVQCIDKVKGKNNGVPYKMQFRNRKQEF